MALRYAPTYDENGDVINPAMFVEGMAVFAGEFNSGLDRDNLPPDSLVDGNILDESFTEVFGGNTDDPFALDNTTTAWQGGEGNDTAGIGNFPFTLEQDAHVIVYWSGSWSWDGTYSWVPAGTARVDHTDTFDTIRIRGTIDGREVFMLGPFEDGAVKCATFGTGSIQLQAGSYTLRIQAESVRRIAQNDQADGQTTNTCTFDERSTTIVVRIR